MGNDEFPRASEAMTSDRGVISVLGAGYGDASISGGAFHEGPAAVRQALATCTTGRPGLGIPGGNLHDAGDLDLSGLDVEQMQSRLAEAVSDLAEPCVVLGGDDSITVGVARGASADGLLTFDAHHDCRDPSVKVTNGSPVRQLIESGDARHVAQIGISPFANGAAPRAWAEGKGISITEAAVVHREGMDAALERASVALLDASRILVDLDLDVLDRVYAPAAPAAMPGGLTPPMIFEAMQRLGADPRVVALAITEHDPDRDINGATARLAAMSLLHFAAGVSTRS